MTKKKRVLLTIRQGKVGGGETHVLDLVRGLNKNIYEPIVLSFTDGEMISILNEQGIQTHVIHTEKPFDFRVWNKVKRFVEKENIALIHAHGTRACSNTFWAARKLNLPIIYTVHGWSFHPNQHKLVQKLREKGESYLCRTVHKTICVSNSCYEEGLKRFPISNAITINNGVNLEKYNADGHYSDVRAALGISKETTLVGYIVRMTIQKDPFTMMNAILKVAEKGEDIHFLIVGDGELKPDMLEFAQKNNLLGHITFQNFRKDIPDILQALDIYCLPSLWEGLPLGVLEAMAMKKGIITTEIPGNTELIFPKKNGLIVPVKDPDALANAIHFLHKHKKTLAEYGEEAYKLVKNQYSLSRMVQETQQVYGYYL